MKSVLLPLHLDRLVGALNAYKLANDLTLYDLAKHTGYQYSEQRIQQILKGTASFETTLALAEALPRLGLTIKLEV